MECNETTGQIRVRYPVDGTEGKVLLAVNYLHWGTGEGQMEGALREGGTVRT